MTENTPTLSSIYHGRHHSNTEHQYFWDQDEDLAEIGAQGILMYDLSRMHTQRE